LPLVFLTLPNFFRKMGGLCCNNNRKSINKLSDVLDAEPKSPEHIVERVEIQIDEKEDVVVEGITTGSRNETVPKKIQIEEKEDAVLLAITTGAGNETMPKVNEDDDSFERLISAEEVQLVLISPKEEKELLTPTLPMHLEEIITQLPIPLSPCKSAKFSTQDPTELLPDLDQFQLIMTDDSVHETKDSALEKKTENVEIRNKLNDTPSSQLVETERSGELSTVAGTTSSQRAISEKLETMDDPKTALAEYVQKRELVQDFYDAILEKPQSPEQSKGSIYAGIKMLEDQFTRKRKVLQDFHDHQLAKMNCPQKKREADQKLTMELLRIDHEEDTSRFKIIQNIMEFDA